MATKPLGPETSHAIDEAALSEPLDLTNRVPIRLAFLATLTIRVAQSHLVGSTPWGFRRVAVFDGGTFIGPRIKAVILSGTDTLVHRDDQTVLPDVRMTLRTDDGALVFVNYRGMRHGAPEVMARIGRDEPVQPDEYYQRNVLLFETAAPAYDWMNRMIAIGTSHRSPGKMIYDTYQIL